MKRLLPILAAALLLLGAVPAVAQSIPNWVDSTIGNTPRPTGDKHPTPSALYGTNGVAIGTSGNPLYTAPAGGGSTVVDVTKSGGTTLESTSTAAGGVPVFILDPATGLRAAIATVVQVNTEGQKASYRAFALNIAAVASATDVFTVCGSASKTVKVTAFEVSGVATAVGTQNVQIIKRSTADTSGGVHAVTVVPLDSTSAAATATVNYYDTTNPTLGTTVGAIGGGDIPLGAAAAVGGSITRFAFGTANARAITLRGTAQCVAVNLTGTIVTGASLDIAAEVTEE